MEKRPEEKAKGAKVVLDRDAPRFVPLWICVSGFESLPPSQIILPAGPTDGPGTIGGSQTRHTQEPPLTSPERARRVDVALDVVFSAHQANYFAKSANVSETGLFLATKRAFAPGTPLHIVFGAPPELPRISSEGVVRWVKAHEGIGVQFTSLTVEERQALRAFLGSHSD